MKACLFSSCHGRKDACEALLQRLLIFERIGAITHEARMRQATIITAATAQAEHIYAMRNVAKRSARAAAVRAAVRAAKSSNSTTTTTTTVALPLTRGNASATEAAEAENGLTTGVEEVVAIENGRDVSVASGESSRIQEGDVPDQAASSTSIHANKDYYRPFLTPAHRASTFWADILEPAEEVPLSAMRDLLNARSGASGKASTSAEGSASEGGEMAMWEVHEALPSFQPPRRDAALMQRMLLVLARAQGVNMQALLAPMLAQGHLLPLDPMDADRPSDFSRVDSELQAWAQGLPSPAANSKARSRTLKGTSSSANGPDATVHAAEPLPWWQRHREWVRGMRMQLVVQATLRGASLEQLQWLVQVPDGVSTLLPAECFAEAYALRLAFRISKTSRQAWRRVLSNKLMVMKQLGLLSTERAVVSVAFRYHSKYAACV